MLKETKVRQKNDFFRKNLEGGSQGVAKVDHLFKKEKKENLGNSSVMFTSWRPFPNI